VIEWHGFDTLRDHDRATNKGAAEGVIELTNAIGFRFGRAGHDEVSQRCGDGMKLARCVERANESGGPKAAPIRLNNGHVRSCHTLDMSKSGWKIAMYLRLIFVGTVRGHFFELSRGDLGHREDAAVLAVGKLHDVGVGVLQEHDAIEVEGVATGGGGDLLALDPVRIVAFTLSWLATSSSETRSPGARCRPPVV
jgi:hypothetical protein